MPPFGKLNYVNIGPHGTLAPTGQLSTTTADIDAIFDYLSSTNQRKLTIHFHGGLVPESSGLATAKEMTSVYAAAGAHPVTFIWETGFLETVKDNLNTINQTELFKKLLALAIKHAMKALGLSFPGKGPEQPLSITEIQAKLASGAPFEDFDATARGAAQVRTEAELQAMRSDILAGIEEDVQADPEIPALLQNEAPRTPLFNETAVAVTESDKQKGILTFAKLAMAVAEIVYRVAKRYLQKHDHGFYPTVVEEVLRQFYLADLGQWVWGDMTTKAGEIWLANDGLQGNSIHGGHYFLEGLAKLQSSSPNLIVDLVGHSAGSIVICQMLKTASAANLRVKIRNIIFMAPACTSGLFHDEIVRNPTRCKAFRMFTMADDYECKNQLVPLVYTRSLLYLISGVLDDAVDKPVAGMARFLQDPPFDDPALRDIGAFLSTTGPDIRLVLSTTADNAPRGLRCTAQRHQDFDENGPMQDSLIFLIGQ
jgi:hypothetical protein